MSRSTHGGNLRAFQKKYQLSNRAILDFSASISPFGLPVGVKEALIQSIDALRSYPDPDCLELRQAIAAHWQIHPDNLIVGNGSTELIHLAARVLSPRRALIPIPTFAEYEDAVHLAGGKCLFLKAARAADFSWSGEGILRRLAQVDLLFLCRPNSPTGYLIPTATLLEIVRACQRQKITVFLDETFLDLVQGPEARSLVGLAAKTPYLMVLRSFTKLYALPGLRLGYLVASKKLVRKMRRVQPPWMVNALAQVAGIEALKERSYAAQTVAGLNQEKKRLLSELSRVPGLVPCPSAANFILCRIASEGIDAQGLSDRLGPKGILIRDCSNYRGLGRRFVRIAVRNQEENERLISSLREVLHGF